MASSMDAAVRKELGEAERSLAALQGELKLVAGKVPESINPAKAEAEAKKVHNWLKRHAPICKLAHSSAAAALPADLQDGLNWLDEVVGELLTLQALLRKASKVQDMDFGKNPDAVLKATRTVAKEIGNPHWVPTVLAKIEKDPRVDTSKKEKAEALVKIIQKGEDIGGIAGGSISSLALLMLLHMIWKFLVGKSAKKPKF